ncbi:MAG: tetratricopeptide repeat protein [Planctomycetaceae bacterium]|jgi:hypothetical protein|nr:tetratricopeptide repeat protein [Planctomycetaceae bacterium]
MQLLSKIISVALFVLFVQFTCDSVISQTGDLYGDRGALGTVQNSTATSTNIVPNRQLQYYQNQYAREPAESRSVLRSSQPMGGYPNNIANVNTSPNSNNNVNGTTIDNRGMYAEAVLKSEKLNTQAQQRGAIVQGRSLPPIPAPVYIAAGSLSRSVLPSSPAIGSADWASTSTNINSANLVNVDNVAGNVNNGLPVVSSVVPRSGEDSFVKNPNVNVGTNSPPISRTAVAQNSGNNSTGNNSNSNGIESNVSSGGNRPDSSRVNSPDNLSASDSGSGTVTVSEASSVKYDSRLKPTESMQEVMSNPQKIKSLIPSFLLRKKVDDPFNEDDGLDMVDKVRRGGVMTEQMYIEFATKSKSVVSKETFAKAMREEEAGNYSLAADLYKEFIKLNSKRTVDGTLAIPYHRLALIAWNRQRAVNEADVYFRYALRYAKEGIVQIIVGDYNKFLTECGKLDQAEAILRNTIALFPHEEQLKVELGRCLAMKDRPIEALRHVKPVLGEAQAYVELAAIYKGRGDYGMSDALMQRRDWFLARSNNRDRVIADASAGGLVSDNFRNDNSGRQTGNIVNTAGITNGNLSSDFGRGVGGQIGVPFPAVARNASNVVGYNQDSNDLPIDPFNVAASVGEMNVVNISSVDGGWQGIDNRQNDPSNYTTQPTPPNQSPTQPESNIPQTYKIKGYHYSVEDVAPVFLQH